MLSVPLLEMGGSGLHMANKDTMLRAASKESFQRLFDASFRPHSGVCSLPTLKPTEQSSLGPSFLPHVPLDLPEVSAGQSRCRAGAGVKRALEGNPRALYLS